MFDLRLNAQYMIFYSLTFFCFFSLEVLSRKVNFEN